MGDSNNNVLWIRAEDISLTDGDDVSTWVDYSGNGNDLTQTDALYKPVFKTNIVNRLPAVRFEKTNGRIRKTNFTDFPTTAITAIYVNKNNGESSDGILSYASSANNNVYYMAVIHYTHIDLKVSI